MNPQMQARLTVVLAAACGVFGLLTLLFWAGVGRGYGFLPPKAGDISKLPSVATIQQQTFIMPEFASFAEVSQRPLFSADRKPIAPDQENAEQQPDAPPVPLQVTLTGVIITPDLKLAMLKDNTTNKDISLREGMPLPGNQAGWLLVEVHPRKVVFKNNEDKISEVELTVSRTSGPPSARMAGATPVQPRSAQRENRQNKEEESLRERIEQRRKELREQAQKMREQQAQASEQQQEQTQ